jgi:hypothetical protein
MISLPLRLAFSAVLCLCGPLRLCASEPALSEAKG